MRELPFRFETDGHGIMVYAVDEAHGISAHVMTLYPGMLVALLKGMFEEHPYETKPVDFKYDSRLEDADEQRYGPMRVRGTKKGDPK